MKRSRLAILATLSAAVIVAQQLHLPLSSDHISISDPHPLARVAEILTARYGVPVSFEEGSGYRFAGDLSDPLRVRQENAAAKSLPPRAAGLDFVNPPFPVAFDHPLPKAAEREDVKGLLQSVLDQHASKDNPGRFKLIEHLTGLVIVPDQTKNSLGNYVADQSVLDLRISFPEIKTSFNTAFAAFCAALSSAAGKQVTPVGGGNTESFSIRADNEVARDVLARLLTLGSFNHIQARGAEPRRAVKSYWILTAEQSLDDPSKVSYGLSFHSVVLERQDRKGNVINQIAIPVID